MSKNSTDALLSSIRSLQKTSEYSDLTIFCGNDVHRVHKAILCPRSPFFAGACRVGKEALKNEISLPDDEPKLVRLMVDYLYQLDYHLGPKPEPEEQERSYPCEPESPVAQVIDIFEDLSGPVEPAEGGGYYSVKKKGKKKKGMNSVEISAPPPLELPPNTPPANTPPARVDDVLCLHARMYALADKYGIDDLKYLARCKFTDEMSEHWDSREFPLAVQTVYSTTQASDYGLRGVVVDTITGHKEMLVERLEVAELVQEINGLAFDLLRDAWNF